MSITLFFFSPQAALSLQKNEGQGYGVGTKWCRKSKYTTF